MIQKINRHYNKLIKLKKNDLIVFSNFSNKIHFPIVKTIKFKKLINKI